MWEGKNFKKDLSIRLYFFLEKGVKEKWNISNNKSCCCRVKKLF